MRVGREGGPPPLRPPRGPSDNIYSSVISPVWDFTPVSELFGLQPRRPLAAGRPYPLGPPWGLIDRLPLYRSSLASVTDGCCAVPAVGAQWSTTVAPSQSRISD